MRRFPYIKQNSIAEIVSTMELFLVEQVEPKTTLLSHKMQTCENRRAEHQIPPDYVM